MFSVTMFYCICVNPFKEDLSSKFCKSLILAVLFYDTKLWFQYIPKVESAIIYILTTSILFSLQQFVKGVVVHLQHASNLENAGARKVTLAKNVARKWNTNVSDIVWKVVPQGIAPVQNTGNHVKKVNIVFKNELKLKTKAIEIF